MRGGTGQACISHILMKSVQFRYRNSADVGVERSVTGLITWPVLGAKRNFLAWRRAPEHRTSGINISVSGMFREYQ